MNSKVLLQSRLFLPVLALVIAVAVLGAFIWRGSGVEAHIPHPGLDFYIAIDEPAITPPNGATATAIPKADNDCDSDPASAPGSTCTLPPGSRFTVKLYLKALPTSVLGYEPYRETPTPGYTDFDVTLNYANVTYQGGSASSAPWPECGFSAVYHTSNHLMFGCAEGFGSHPSTYVGLLGTADFVCSADGPVTMVHGSNDTHLNAQHAEGDIIIPTATLTNTPPGFNGLFTPSPTSPPVFTTPTYVGNLSETLTVNCNGPTATPTRTPRPQPLGGVALYPDGPNWNGGLRVALLAGLGALVAVAASVVGWRRVANR